jgi:hypothetical protein
MFTAMNSYGVQNISWNVIKKFLFRFCFVYFFVYCFPFPVDAFEFTKPVASPYYKFVDWLVPHVANWFHLHAVVSFPMFDKFDDSNYGLTLLYFNLLFSCVAAITWSVIDRRKDSYKKLYQWLKLYLRFFLAAYLFGYGFVKIFPSQFQAISASRLTLTVGEQSPMLLAWNFMGYSVVMMRINGIAEVLAGILLLFRRTTTIGAILSAAVFSFVVMMDFCFNVPVRLLASHLFIISVFLALGDGSRMLNVFVLNKPTTSAIYIPLISDLQWRKIFSVLQALLAISILCSGLLSGVEAERDYGWNSNSKAVPLYGVYNTVYFMRNNDTILPLETDTFRWKQLVIDGGNWKQTGIIELGTGKKFICNVKADTVKRIISVQSSEDTTESYMFHYLLPNDSSLLLKGIWKRDSIEVLLNKYDLNNYLLHREKFTWINR